MEPVTRPRVDLSYPSVESIKHESFMMASHHVGVTVPVLYTTYIHNIFMSHSCLMLKMVVLHSGQHVI